MATNSISRVSFLRHPFRKLSSPEVKWVRLCSCHLQEPDKYSLKLQTLYHDMHDMNYLQLKKTKEMALRGGSRL